MKRAPHRKASRNPLGEWQKKLKPDFLSEVKCYAELVRLEAIRNPTPKEKARVLEIWRNDIPKLVQAFNLGRPANQQATAYQLMYTNLCFLKTGKFPGQLLEEYTWDARRKILRVGELYGRHIHGKVRPQDLRFKRDPHETGIILGGLGRGIEKLNEQELENFFNQYCPCGNTEHSGEALKRLRSRIRKAIHQPSEIGGDSEPLSTTQRVTI